LHLRIVWWNNNVERERERERERALNWLHKTGFINSPSVSIQISPNVPTRHTSSIIQFYISIQNVSSDSLMPYWAVYHSVYTMKRWCWAEPRICVFLSFYTHFHSTHLQWF
jgi:hypothetical protein